MGNLIKIFFSLILWSIQIKKKAFEKINSYIHFLFYSVFVISQAIGWYVNIVMQSYTRFLK